MRPHTVKMITDNDGEPTFDNSWHYINKTADEWRTLCTGEVLIDGAETEQRIGRITCPNCRAIIKEIKAIDLR